jgi:hypothetical protein
MYGQETHGGRFTTIAVIHTVCWATITISALGFLKFRQIHFEDLEKWSLVLVE